MSKKVIMIIAMLAAVLGQAGVAYGENLPPSIASGTGVVIDSSTGTILYQKDKDEQAYPASLTKLMTAILLEEHMANGEWMTASKKATLQEASNFVFNLKVGERMQKEEALKALLVISANDVAMMIAEHIGGDEASFADLMNKRAASIGMTHTHFVTPNGLHDPQHVTTAGDLALLAKEAMKYPDVMAAMGMEKTEVKTDQRQVVIRDRSLIFENPLATGGKTGFTDQAHNTLIEYMKQDNKTVISVVMKSSKADEYHDVEAIGKYGLNRLDVQMTLQKGEVVGGTTFYGERVEGVLGQSMVLTRMKEDNAEYTYKPVYSVLHSGLKTIEAGEVIGAYQVLKNGALLTQIPIVSLKRVTHVESPPSSSGKSSAPAPWWGWGAICLPVLAYGFYKLQAASAPSKTIRS